MVKNSQNLLQKVLSQTLIVRLCILFLLVASSFFISYLLQSNTPFFLQESFDQITLLTPNYRFGVIQKGQKVRLESTIHYSYFGILAMRFNTSNRINSDSLIFRIKEKGSPTWYYQNTYKTDQFQNNKLFPFGFPPIKDSHNKTFVYEIESMKGNNKDGVALSHVKPIISATFQYSSTRILSAGLEGITFVLLKYLHGLESPENIPAILSPFIIYVLYKRFLQRGNQENVARLVLIILALLSIFYILLLGKIFPGSQTNSLGISVALLIFWIMFVVRYKIQSNFWFLLAIFFLLCMVFVLFFRRPDLGERAGALAYGFILIGVVHAVIELRFPFRSSRTIYEVLTFIIPLTHVKKMSKLLRRVK